MGSQEVTVYTRPGCPFCMSLRAGLRRRGMDFTEVDIWQDPDAAATVRSLAEGNETVPTVVIGEWSAVNPSASQVVEAADTHAPERVPDRKPGAVEGAINALGFRSNS
ncbi:glutaredoxin-like protein [Halopolyspora algeriensis]|uniref:Glutaredoxin-like protein n=1 Tax=Halopolyspora algeriensis TaxID=1500506 RepID=A0A368W3F0_9ACTN|nr:glutaredoxin domain-containing protein [Halopolyspora algeriensis]RCW47203.1 glutaredoxin-like protein [Halopolyspora algeriensis]TQM48289.1 glutaredoxin-like protein [Halopolyspora algeriensis]